MSKSDRVDVYLVAGGKYHNIDFARLEILKLLAEQPRIKVQVGADYSDIESPRSATLGATTQRWKSMPRGLPSLPVSSTCCHGPTSRSSKTAAR